VFLTPEAIDRMVNLGFLSKRRGCFGLVFVEAGLDVVVEVNAVSVVG
jgi:hypothetical protein